MNTFFAKIMWFARPLFHCLFNVWRTWQKLKNSYKIPHLSHFLAKSDYLPKKFKRVDGLSQRELNCLVLSDSVCNIFMKWVLMLTMDLWAVIEVIIIYHPYMSLDSSKCNINTKAMRALYLIIIAFFWRKTFFSCAIWWCTATTQWNFWT